MHDLYNYQFCFFAQKSNPGLRNLLSLSFFYTEFFRTVFGNCTLFLTGH